MQAYSNPERETDSHALPNIEVFYWSQHDKHALAFYSGQAVDESLEPGWYWQSCFPGCLPDSEPIGPFDTESEALANAQDWDY